MQHAGNFTWNYSGHNCKVKFIFAAVLSVCSSVSYRIQLQRKCDVVGTLVLPGMRSPWNTDNSTTLRLRSAITRVSQVLGYSLISSKCLNEVCRQRFYIYVIGNCEDAQRALVSFVINCLDHLFVLLSGNFKFMYEVLNSRTATEQHKIPDVADIFVKVWWSVTWCKHSSKDAEAVGQSNQIDLSEVDWKPLCGC